MGDIRDIEKMGETQLTDSETEVLEMTTNILASVRADFDHKRTMNVPIAELATLGAGVSSLIPAFNTVTQTSTLAMDGVYKVINAGVGDALKQSKSGFYWGSVKTEAGKSIMAKLQEVGELSIKTESVAAINPATMLMAASLYLIEKELGEIAETQKQIIGHLEIENEAQIEADVETLMAIVGNYKYIWDSNNTLANNHNQVMDIQRTARKDMIAYQKKVAEILAHQKHITGQKKVNKNLDELEKKFKYYRLSLYTYAMASMLEIMLSSNFNEAYMLGVKDEINRLSLEYRTHFEEASLHLEKMGKVSVEANVIKGIGTAGSTVGKVIGSIPLIRRGPVDEFLQEGGSHLKNSAIGMQKDAVYRFSEIGNPGTSAFIHRIEDMNQIYNHTDEIYFDDKNIYLIAN